MEISYDELRRIYRLEKNTSKLAEVDDTFYDDLADFIENEKKDYLASLKSFSSVKARNFTNMKRIVEEIFSLREKKILSKALIASRSGEENDEKMPELEKKTFKELLAVLDKYREFLRTAFETDEQKSAQKEKISLKIAKEVPAFVGPNMKEYGPFSVDETVSLPLKVGELLLARKLAVENK